VRSKSTPRSQTELPPIRVAIYSHAHPRLRTGGTEIASHNLFRGLRRQEGVEAIYVAYCEDRATENAPRSVVKFGNAEDEYIFFQSEVDHLYFYNANIRFLQESFIPFLREKRIDVLHLHHVLGLGINAIPMIKSAIPGIKIFLTFHEFLSICQNHGQMITRGFNALCERPNALTCAKCFPDAGVRAMALRELLFKRAYEYVDAFFSPSKFLLERFVDWGLPREKMRFLENGQNLPDPIADAATDPPLGERLRFGFFGSFNPFKGLLVVLAAAKILRTERVPVNICIYGSMDHLDQTARDALKSALQQFDDVITYHGPYQPSRAVSLMRSCDWIIVPSIWWENSPVTIEEAIMARRPILASDIGGMREKVENNVFGLHFRVGDGADLATKIKHIAKNPGITTHLSKQVRTVKGLDAAAREHLMGYGFSPRGESVLPSPEATPAADVQSSVPSSAELAKSRPENVKPKQRVVAGGMMELHFGDAELPKW
jgi:glycosyltransferase involved in cell wall biosynthesis